MAGDEYKIIVSKIDFYRSAFRRTFIFLVTLGLSTFALILLVTYMWNNKPMPVYFAARSDGVIIPIQPLNQPVVSQSQLTSWVSSAIVSVYAYDYLRYRSQLQNAQQYFSADGWSDFLASLRASGNLVTVRNQKLMVSAVPTGSAVITNRRILNGAFTWQVEMPLLVTYEGSSSQRSQSVLVRVIVSRVPIQNNPQGIAIQKFVSSALNVTGG